MSISKNDLDKAIMELFGMPKNCVSYEIRSSVDESVTVACEFYPEMSGGDAETVVKKFKMVPVEEEEVVKPEVEWSTRPELNMGDFMGGAAALEELRRAMIQIGTLRPPMSIHGSRPTDIIQDNIIMDELSVPYEHRNGDEQVDARKSTNGVALLNKQKSPVPVPDWRTDKKRRWIK